MPHAANFEEQRRRMVAEQLVARDIRDPRVLNAMLEVPRHLFVSEADLGFAYADGPLPIGEGQTISQPYIVALMTQWLDLEGEEKVLEVGTGSGYQAAILGRLARQVHTIEQHPALAERAEKTLQALKMNNVHVHCADGSLGLESEAPFDAILVTAAAPHAPQALLEQLVDGGRMVLPVGNANSQYLQRWNRRGDRYTYDDLAPVSFVPLRGEQGWGDEYWGRP